MNVHVMKLVLDLHLNRSSDRPSLVMKKHFNSIKDMRSNKDFWFEKIEVLRKMDNLCVGTSIVIVQESLNRKYLT